MTKLPSSFVLFAVTVLLVLSSPAHSLGSSSTVAVTSAGPTVCGVVSSTPVSSITCYSGSRFVPLLPNISFSTVSGDGTTLCGVRSGDYSFFCWDTTNLSPRRVYYNASATVVSLSVGDDRICATLKDTATGTSGAVKCWRVREGRYPAELNRFDSISSGSGFFCGILSGTGGVRCWGSDQALAGRIQDGFAGAEMASIACGGAHACGLDASGLVTCRGDNSSGQLGDPGGRVEYTQVAAGSEHTCGIRAANGSVTCWGGGFRGSGDSYNNITNGVSFTTIASGSNFTCGVVTETLSVACWGPGWTGSGYETVRFNHQILPGPCVVDDSSCGGCGVVPSSRSMCSGAGVICQRCNPSAAALAPSPEIPLANGRSKTLTTGLLVFAVVGSIGALSGICTVIYCLWTGVCFGKKKVHNSVQPTITRGGSNSSNSNGNSRSGMFSRSSTIRRQGSRVMGRQRSGTSSKHADHRAEEFSLSELVEATDGFALENKIGSGSFGVVYRGKLRDGREVAIKRGDMRIIINSYNKNKKLQEKENAFESELSFLSRLHHKHLVRLVGFCEDGEERLLVYEYMKNGALYDHLHDKNNLEKSSNLINSWKIRIKIALDAARGIEYLHNYAVPPIIHRDIKSSNILLDGSWTARVSDFGLSLMGGEQSQPMKAAGTVGYIDPEYYGLNVLTAKSDVYGFGVVLLEIITGRRAIFKGEEEWEDGGNPTSLVDFAVPKIMSNELVKILDPRVGPPEINEAEAVELMANTAMHCVHLEGKDRPTMSDIVSSLERALALCDDCTHGSISSGIISLVSD